MACSLNIKENHIKFLALTALELKEKIQSLREDENIDIHQYVRDIYQEYFDDGFSEKDAAEYAQFVPNAIKRAMGSDVVYHVDPKQLRSLEKDFESFDNVLKFVKGESVLTKEELNNINEQNISNSLSASVSANSLSNDDAVILDQNRARGEQNDRYDRNQEEGALDKTINRKGQKEESSEPKQQTSEVETNKTDINKRWDSDAALAFNSDVLKEYMKVKVGPLHKARSLKEALSELDSFLEKTFKWSGVKTTLNIKTLKDETSETTVHEFTIIAGGIKFSVEGDVGSSASIGIEGKTVSIDLKLNKIVDAKYNTEIAIVEESLTDVKSKEEEFLFDALHENVFSSFSRSYGRDQENIEEDPEEAFYSNFIIEFDKKLNDSGELAEEVTFGGHTGFKLKIMKSNDLNPLDKEFNYIGKQEHLRKSHYDYITDPNYVPYKYSKKSEKEDLISRKQKHVKYAITLVITDLKGNPLYFTSDKNNQYAISTYENGKPVYFNTRRTFGTPAQRKNGKWKNLLSAYKQAEKNLKGQEATEKEKEILTKQIIKKTNADIDILENLISLALTGNPSLLNIEKINPGYVVQQFTNSYPLSDIAWNKLNFEPKFKLNASNQLTMTSDPEGNTILISSPRIKDTKYMDILSKLLTISDLRLIENGIESKLSLNDRIDFIKTYVYDVNIEFINKNEKLIIKKTDKKKNTKSEISPDEFIKSIDNWFLGVIKNNLKLTTIRDINNITNKSITLDENKNYLTWIKNNFSSSLPTDTHKTIPLVGGYIIYSISEESKLQINPEDQENLENFNIDPIATRLPYDKVISYINNVLLKQKSFIKLSEDRTHYEHIKDGKVIARYKRITDIIDAKGYDLEIFSELDRNNAFELKKDPDTGQSYFVINDKDLTEKAREYLYNDDKSPIANRFMETNIKQMLNLKVSTEVGIAMDTIFRDFFKGETRNFDEYTEQLGFAPFENEKLFNEYLNYLEKLQNYFNNNNLEVITEEIRLYSEVLGIAGTIDMLTVNKNTGEIGFIDLKTKKNLRYWAKGFDNSITGHDKTSKQLSAYRIMAHNQNNLLVESIKALIGKTDYDGKMGNPTAKSTTLGGPFSKTENPNKVKIIDGFFLELKMLDKVNNPKDILIQLSEPLTQPIQDQTDETKEQIKKLNKEKKQIEEALEESNGIIETAEQKSRNKEEVERLKKEKEKKEKERTNENLKDEIDKIPVTPPKEIQTIIDFGNDNTSEKEKEQLLDKAINDTKLSKKEEEALDKEKIKSESRSDVIKRLIPKVSAIKDKILKKFIQKIIKLLQIITIASTLTFTTGAVGLKSGVIQNITSNTEANSFISDNINPDIANVLTLPMEDIMDIGMNFYYKKTKTGPYSEEAIKNMKLKLVQDAQEEEARIEALYKAQQIEKAEYAAEMERIRQENLIFLKDPISIGLVKYTFKNDSEMRPVVIDLTSENVRFDIAHNVKAPKAYYSDQPNKTIPNSHGIIGAFHNKFVAYRHTANNKFHVPVQIAWNTQTKIFTVKKTKDLLPTDLVVPYGDQNLENITKLDDLDIKKLEDGSFDITTGIDKSNGTSIIKTKKGKTFHIGLEPGGKERVLNSKDLNEYRPLRGGMVIIFDDEAEVSVLVTSSVHEIFHIIDQLQKKHPEKKWNILKGDTGSYATSAITKDGKTDKEDIKSYSNQNTYGRSQFLILLKPEKKTDTTPINASLILFGLLAGLRSRSEFGTEITDQEISELKDSIKEAKERLDEINKEIASLQIEGDNENIIVNNEGLIIKENAIDDETSIEIVNQIKPIIEETSYKQTKGSTSFDMGLRWTRTNSLKGEKMIRSIIPGKQLNGKEVTQEMIDEAAKSERFGKNWPLYVYSKLDRNGNKLPNIPTKIITLLEEQGIDISEYEASYNSVYDKKDKGSLVIHQDNTEQDSTYPIITISLGRPMKFITYELNDPNEFSLTDSETTPYRIAVTLVTKNLKSKPKYGVITPSNIIKYAKQAEKDSGNKNIVDAVKDLLKVSFKESSRNEYILENGTVLVFSGNNRNVMHEIVFDEETDKISMPAGFPTLSVNKAFTGLGHADRFKPTNDYRVVLTLRKVTPGKKGSSVVNESKFTSSNEPIKIDKAEAPQDKTEWTSKMGPNISKTINIYAGTGENAALSNFAERPFVAASLEFVVGEGVVGRLYDFTYNTVEGAFQAAKLQYTDSYSEKEKQELSKKLSNMTGVQAKAAGQKIKGLKTAEWDKDSSIIMDNVISDSFGQNKEAAQMLVATGDAILTHTQDKGKWGKEFPRLLMKSRELFKEFYPSKAKPINEVNLGTETAPKGGKVVIDTVKGKKPQPGAVVAFRTKGKTEQNMIEALKDNAVGNPFGPYAAIKEKDDGTAVTRFLNWLKGEDDIVIMQDYRQALLDKVPELKGKTIYYYKDLGKPSHATALDYFLNKLTNQGENPAKFDDLFRLKPRSKTTRTETRKQIKRAEKWYNENMPRFPKGHEKAGELMLPFRAAYNIVNSNAYAQFTTQGVLLFKGSNATDLYHEAWHGFTQLFLTSQERTELYEDVRKDSGTFKTHKGETKKFSEASRKEIEEYLAEDFRHYGMSKGKIAKKGVRKNIFQKIWDFLFGWIGKYNYVSTITRPETLENIRLLQKNLYNGNIEQNKYDVNNAEWGVLSYGIEPIDEDENSRSVEESLLINESVDMLLSDFINEQNERTGDARWTSAYLVKPELLYKFGYKHVLDKFVEKRAEFITRLKNFEMNSNEEERLNNKISILNFAINNFGELNEKNKKGIIAYNLKFNKQFDKNISEQITLDELNDLTEIKQWIQTVEGSSNKLSSLDSARNSTINLVKSLHKYTKKGIKEENILEFPVPVDFSLVWNRLQKILVGSLSATEMWNRLNAEIKSDPKIQNLIIELKSKLGDPTNDKKSTLSEENTWSGFWQTFNKSYSPLEQLTVNKLTYENGVKLDTPIIKVNYGKASSNVSKISFDISSNFKIIEDAKGYIIKDSEGIRSLNFKKNSPLRRMYPERKDAENNPYNFLYDIGIRLEDNKLIKDALKEDDLKNRVGWIYAHLKTLFNKAPNTIITDIIKDLMTKQSGNLNAILELQVRYSDSYHSFMQTNANNEQQNQHTYNNELTVIINAINSSENFNELVNKPYMSYLSIESNPAIRLGGNRLINAIFDLSSLNGPKKLDAYGNPVKLEISNLAGIVALIDDRRSDGIVNTDLNEYDKLIFDIESLLLGGKSEIARAETTRSSYAIGVSDLKLAKFSPSLYVDLYEFYDKNNIVIEESENKDYTINKGFYKTILFFIDDFQTEIERIKRLNLGNEIEVFDWSVDVDGIKARSKTIQTFKGMLSDELIKKIEKDISKTDISSEEIINKYKIDIIKNMNIYLRNLVNETYDIWKNMPFISRDLKNKLNIELKKQGIVNNTQDKNLIDKSIIAAFVTNQYLNKLDLMYLFFGDATQYNMPKEGFTKRNKGANSTGDLMRTDPKLYNFLNDVSKQLYAESIGHEPIPFNGIVNSVISDDIIVKSERYNEYKNTWTEYYAKLYLNLSNAEINKLSDKQVEPYEKLNEPDGAALITFDMYKFFSITHDKWSPQQDELYKKIINKENIDGIDITEFFPVRKYQYYGPMAVPGKMPVWVYHKYSLMPLIPGITATGNLEKLHNKLVKTDNHYFTYVSGSKLGIKIKNSKFNTLYSEKVEPGKNRIFNENEEWITNPLYLEFLKDQIDSNSTFKGKTTFATQGRKVLISGLFNDGIALSKQISKLVNEYEYLITKRTRLTEKLIKDETGYDETSNDKSGIVSIIRSSLESGKLAPHEYDSINVNEETLELEIDFSLLLNSTEIEKLLISYANRKVIKQRFNGEMNVQVPSTGFEMQLTGKLTKAQQLEHGTNGLRMYSREGLKKGELTISAQTKIALQGDFKLLLKAEHLDGKVIGNRERLNEMIQDPKWLDINDHRKMITITGPRIPTAGPNMIEFFEIWEFLHEKAGNIIVLPSEIVAKSGTDYDYDKLTTYYMNIISVNNKPELVKHMDVKESKEDLEERKDFLYEEIDAVKLKIKETTFKKAFDSLSEELKTEFTTANLKFLNETLDLRKRISILRKTWKKSYDIKNKAGYIKVKQNNMRLEIDSIQEQINNISDKYKLHNIQLNILIDEKKKLLDPLYNELGIITRKLASLTTKGIDNEIIDVSIEIMKQPEYFLQLIEPLNSDKLEYLAEKIKNSRISKKKYSPFRDTRYAKNDTDQYVFSDEIHYTKIFETPYLINKHLEMTVGMEVLGIYAQNLPMKALINKNGLFINKINHSYPINDESDSSKGQGSVQGDSKDKLMRDKADGFIGELIEIERDRITENLWDMKSRSSTGNSFAFIGRKESRNEDFLYYDNNPTVVSGIANFDEKGIIMLARNSEFRNFPLDDYTKEAILNIHESGGSTFIVGDMPGVDIQFVEYLQEIGAKFVVYTNGYNRLKMSEINIPLPHNEKSGKQLKMYDIEEDKVISLSGLMDANNDQSISYINSALLNGAVDVGNSSWLFDINAGIENAPSIVTLNNAGVPYEYNIFLHSNPIVTFFNKRSKIYDSIFKPYTFKKVDDPITSVLKNLGIYGEYKNEGSKVKFIYDFIEEFKSGFTLENIKDIALNGVNPDNKDIAIALFLFYYITQDTYGLADQYKQLTQTLNYDTTKLLNLHEINNKEVQSNDIVKLSAFPNKQLINLRDHSIISPFNTGKFQLEMWSSLFKITYNSKINDALNMLMREETETMMMEYGNMSRQRFVNVFKQDLINYIFQQDLFKNLNISKGVKYGYDIVEDNVPSYILDEMFKASRFASIIGNKFYMDKRRLIVEFNNNNKNYPELKSFNDFKAYIIEKAYLEHVITADELVNDINFISIYDNLKSNSENIDKKIIVKAAFEKYLSNKALDNLLNRYKNFISNDSYANQFMEIKNKYEGELEEYIFIKNVHIDKGTTIKNLKLLERVKEEEKTIAYYNSLQKLMDPSIKKVSNDAENKMISEFFQKFPLYAYLQTGPDTNSPLSFMKIIPDTDILKQLRNIQDEVINNLNTSDKLIHDKTLEDYISSFRSQRSTNNRSNSFRSLDYIGKQTTLANVNTAIDMDTEKSQYILMNPNVKNIIEKYKDKTNITFVLVGNTDKTMAFTNNSNFNISKEYEEGRIKVLSLYKRHTLNSNLRDDTYNDNIKALTNDLEEIKNISDNGNSIIFLTEGYSNLKIDAPRTNLWLLNQLKEKFEYQDLDLKTQDVIVKTSNNQLRSNIEEFLNVTINKLKDC